MNDTDVQATNTDYKPKLHKNHKLVLQIWLVNNNVVPGSTKMLIQEHVALGKIRFCHRVQQTYQSGVVDGHNEVKERLQTCSMTGRVLLHLPNTENTPFNIQTEPMNDLLQSKHTLQSSTKTAYITDHEIISKWEIDT